MPKTAQKGASVATVKKQGAVMKHIKKYWQWYAMMFIPIVYYIVFRYIPMFGNIIAFRRYRAGSSIFGDEWSGLKYFNQFMKDQNFWRAFKNTLLLNFKYLIISFPLTLIFALLLNEVKNVHFKKIVQTISYLPHFISMVIVAGMVREILSTSGPINNLITKLGGEAITFISLPEWFTTIFVTTGVWQGLGWGTILYLAAMSGGNTELLTSNFTEDLRDFYDRQGQYRKLRPLDPTVTFDEDQMEMLNLWGTPMTDTVNAWTCKFAMNQADINNDWDTYVAEVEAQNMQNIVDMYNDTYNANK